MNRKIRAHTLVQFELNIIDIHALILFLLLLFNFVIDDNGMAKVT